MKTVYKFLTMGAMMATFAVAGVSSTFAQDQDREARKADLYTKFTNCYKETDKQKLADCYSTVAKPYLDEFEKDNDQYGSFVRKKYDAYNKGITEGNIISRFEGDIKNPATVNADDAFLAAKDVLNLKPELSVDVPIVLASIGFDKAVANPPVDKFNNEAINYAMQAIQQIEAGKPSVTGSYGVFGYSYKNKDYADGKTNALGWMNYIIGYIKYNRMQQKKDALPYLYKASQLNSATKNIPDLYQAIGNYYVEEFVRLDKERLAKIEAAGKQDTDETKALLDLQRGYADRALEAFARAYKVTGNDAATAKYKDGLLGRAKELYGIRYDNNMSGFDAYLSSVTNKPFTDPTMTVAPIQVATPTTTSSTPSMSTTMTTASPTNTATTARPTNSGASTSTATTKTPAPTTTKAATTAPKTTTKTPAKTTTTKKKGTR